MKNDYNKKNNIKKLGAWTFKKIKYIKLAIMEDKSLYLDYSLYPKKKIIWNRLLREINLYKNKIEN